MSSLSITEGENTEEPLAIPGCKKTENYLPIKFRLANLSDAEAI